MAESRRKTTKTTKKTENATAKATPVAKECVDCSVLADCCSVKTDEGKWLGKVLTAKTSSFDEALKFASDNNRPLLVQFCYDGCGECEAYNKNVTDTKAWANFLKENRIVMYRTSTVAEMNAVYRKYSNKDYKLGGSYPWLVMYGVSKGQKGLEASTAKVEKTFGGLQFTSAVKGTLWTAQGIGLGGMNTLFGVKLPQTKNMTSKDIENLVNAWFPNNFWDKL